MQIPVTTTAAARSSSAIRLNNDVEGEEGAGIRLCAPLIPSDLVMVGEPVSRG